MSITKDQMLEAFAAMSVMEVVELIEAMEEKFGVSAAAAVVAGGADAVAAAEEKTEFDVVMRVVGFAPGSRVNGFQSSSIPAFRARDCVRPHSPPQTITISFFPL